ncbi:MAG: U32 family peptidase [Deltaproteobacteria bacterium]|nr:U32 family peptidase [Deltaproteobacteria bacterium]
MTKNTINNNLFPSLFRFSIPYVYEPSYSWKLLPWKKYIKNVYIPIPSDLMGSGRQIFEGDPLKFKQELPEIIIDLEEKGLTAQLLCNSPFPDIFKIGELKDYLKRLIDCGLRNVTVAFLPLAAMIHREFPEIEITASTVAFIHDTAMAEQWIDRAGVKSIVPDRSLNKRLDKLAVLKKTGVALTVVADDGCLPSCPLQYQHYCLVSYLDKISSARDKEADEKAIESFCGKYERANTWRLYQSDLVPANLPYYAGLVETIKFARIINLKKADLLIREMQHYMDTNNRCSFFFGYYEPPEVFEKIRTCDRLCMNCGWCGDLFHRSNERTDSPDAKMSLLWRPKGRVKVSTYAEPRKKERVRKEVEEKSEKQIVRERYIESLLDFMKMSVLPESSGGWKESDEGILLRFNDGGSTIVILLSPPDEKEQAFFRTSNFNFSYTVDEDSVKPDMRVVDKLKARLLEWEEMEKGRCHLIFENKMREHL